MSQGYFSSCKDSYGIHKNVLYTWIILYCSLSHFEAYTIFPFSFALNSLQLKGMIGQNYNSQLLPTLPMEWTPDMILLRHTVDFCVTMLALNVHSLGCGDSAWKWSQPQHPSRAGSCQCIMCPHHSRCPQGEVVSHIHFFHSSLLWSLHLLLPSTDPAQVVGVGCIHNLTSEACQGKHWDSDRFCTCCFQRGIQYSLPTVILLALFVLSGQEIVTIEVQLSLKIWKDTLSVYQETAEALGESLAL